MDTKKLIKPAQPTQPTYIKPLSETKKTGTALEFIEKLFASRDAMHFRHLNPTKAGMPSSFAEHKALNDYYDGLLDFLDGFVESYQGKHGLIEIELTRVASEDPVSHLTALVNYVETNKDAIFPDSYLNNQVDELITLIYSTLYKLKYLK